MRSLQSLSEKKFFLLTLVLPLSVLNNLVFCHMRARVCVWRYDSHQVTDLKGSPQRILRVTVGKFAGVARKCRRKGISEVSGACWELVSG